MFFRKLPQNLLEFSENFRKLRLCSTNINPGRLKLFQTQVTAFRRSVHSFVNQHNFMGSDQNNPKMDFSFLWSQGIHVILDQKSNLGFTQRNAPLVSTWRYLKIKRKPNVTSLHDKVSGRRMSHPPNGYKL